MKFFPKSTLSASIHSTVYGRPTSCRKWTSKKTKYGQPWDVRRRRLKAVVPLEELFTSRMGRDKFGHRDVQWIDDGWECATRDDFIVHRGYIGLFHIAKIQLSKSGNACVS